MHDGSHHVLADYIKPFLLETDVSKDGLGVVLSQKQADGQYYPIAYGSRGLMPHEKNHDSTKLEFLALKWAVTEHFKEYLPYQSFVVWTGNNLLMYIMSTPNLDAMGHQWVGALALFNFELEYRKGYYDVPCHIWQSLNILLPTIFNILYSIYS